MLTPGRYFRQMAQRWPYFAQILLLDSTKGALDSELFVMKDIDIMTVHIRTTAGAGKWIIKDDVDSE